MDKLYFYPESSSIPHDIRASLSELTNIVLQYQENKVDKQTVLVALDVLRSKQHYQTNGNDFAAHLFSDLDSVCYFWQEPWRFEQCWPPLSTLIEEL
ncbi:hypothetical protein ACSLBF_19370 (plasmid) [Pseudoalteromonas sp. T1lg65]|uniref:hypothetical protein n=1 Tax=Pseudoalteromonas sp. T1lg65 TaxID=2077101 RepID=UPI003F7B074B